MPGTAPDDERGQLIIQEDDMNLSDLENDPPTIAEEYAPDPRASQRVAARKRLRDTDQALSDSAPTPPRASVAIPPAQQLVAIVVVAILTISAVAIMVMQRPGQAPRPLVTPEPTFETASQAAPAAPQSTEAPRPTQEVAIDAYAAPDGAVLGPIEIGRANDGRAVAHCRADWVQADVPGSGLVWFPSPNVRLAPTGPDLCAAPAPAPQTGRGPAPEWTPPSVEQPEASAVGTNEQPAVEIGEKPADDRAARHRAAIERLQRPPSNRDDMPGGTQP